MAPPWTIAAIEQMESISGLSINPVHPLTQAL